VTGAYERQQMRGIDAERCLKWHSGGYEVRGAYEAWNAIDVLALCVHPHALPQGALELALNPVQRRG